MARYRNKKETKKVGSQIKKLRQKQGWSIEDIASMTGFARSTISSIENGSETDTTHLIEIAKAIGVHPNQLFNITVDLKPRFKLTQKRKDQNKLTFKIRSLVESGYFNGAKVVSEVRQHLFDNQKLKISAAQISVVLLRLVNDGKLKSSKVGRRNLYHTR